MKADVVILGGGLAGLTLSLQLRRRFPDLDILVLERRRHPVPEAAHKVGESSVEIAANYFDTVLGLGEHLAQRQLKKFGFRFFFSEGRRDIDGVLELGASTYFTTPTYQIDRGIFENFLGQHACAAGVRFIDGITVRGIELGQDEAAHAVSCELDGEPVVVQARWLVDASGRAGLLKRKLGLSQENDHDVNSAWFRIGSKIDINEWSSDPQWLGRCNPPNRWLSTTHLVGEGYWVWLIPLASGSHSVGIVADARIHPLSRINTFGRALDWLRQFQPRLADDLESKREQLQDFVFLKHFSYGCKKVFSGDRWAMTGESGVFLDPFYSPGSDFIAIANTYVTELVAHDRARQNVHAFARIYEQLFMSYYDSTMSLYRDQYKMIVVLGASINLVIGSASAKWGMLAPVLVPMLMLLGISPEMTTAAFRMGDSVTNPITPLLVYFPLALVFCQRWVPGFGMGSLIAAMLPYSLGFLVIGLLMTSGWVFFDLPVGPGASVGYTLPGGAVSVPQ